MLLHGEDQEHSPRSRTTHSVSLVLEKIPSDVVSASAGTRTEVLDTMIRGNFLRLCVRPSLFDDRRGKKTGRIDLFPRDDNENPENNKNKNYPRKEQFPDFIDTFEPLDRATKDLSFVLSKMNKDVVHSSPERRSFTLTCFNATTST
eukprot:GSA120T00001057001.1